MAEVLRYPAIPNTKSLTERQQQALQTINGHILNPFILETRCPLDYGRLIHKPWAGLGDLGKLSTEIQCEVMGYVDVETLVKFRSVSSGARDLVDGMMEWKLVMKHAPNTIRMAIGIRTAYRFSIRELFAVLCERLCGISDYRHPAPYVDLFNLSRRCLSVGRGCQTPQGFTCGPRSAVQLNNHCPIGKTGLSGFPSFHAIGIQYGYEPSDLGLARKFDCYDHFGYADRFIYYDTAAMHAFTNSHNPEKLWKGYFLRGGLTLGIDPCWKLSAVFAPWLSPKGGGAEYGVFYRRKSIVSRRNLLMRVETLRAGEYSPIEMPFGTVEQMRIQEENKHKEFDTEEETEQIDMI